MHNMIGSSGMDQNSHLAPDHTYMGDHWAGMNPYGQISMPAYGGDYYIPSSSHGLPSESIHIGHMGPPPVPQQVHHQQSPHFPGQMPPSLMIPTQTNAPQVSWPSLRTNPGQSYSSPPVPIPPQTAVPPPPPAIKQQPKLPSITTSTPRKTLTNEDRRLMCQYAEDHPKSKQNEIGLKFGVERR
jgi:hypothetical protein